MEDASLETVESELLETPDEEELSPLGYRKNPLSLVLPVREGVLFEARRVVGGRSLQVEHLAECVNRDPVFMLALLRMANAMLYRQDRSALTTARAAVVRLGASSLVELVDSLEERANIVSPEIYADFDAIKDQGMAIAHIAGIISSVIDNSLSQEARTIGLLSVMGHLVICANLGPLYPELAEGRTRASLEFRLCRDYEQDPLEIRRDYLKRHGFPQSLLFAVDPETVSPSSNRLSLRFIVSSAVEIVDVYGTSRWERYADKDELPSSSSLRLLKLNEPRYKRMLESITDYLDSLHAIPEETEAPLDEDGIVVVTEPLDEEPQTDYERELALEKRRVLVEAEQVIPPQDEPPAPSLVGSIPTDQELSTLVRKKKLEPTREDLPEPEEIEAQDILKLCHEARNVKELLKKVIEVLTDEGPFVRAALIVLGKDGEVAHVYDAAGEGIEAGSTIRSKDPFCPIFSPQTKIYSCNRNESENTPFGVSSFAVTPLDVGVHTPVILYADCGNDGAISFAARKFFRYTVGQLSDLLPRLTDGISAVNS